MPENMQIVLASRPHGEPRPENFRTETTPLPVPGEGEVLLRNLYLSLDPYMRGRMSDAKSYIAPFEVDAPLQGGTVGEVLQCNSPDLAVGDVVLAFTTWSTHAVAPAQAVRKISDNGAPLSTALGVLGMPGFTAYAGLAEIGQPKEGETLVVAAATGPVGSLVGQLAQRAGARAVGIAGGPDKCAYLREIGFDAAIDHRSPTFVDDLAAATPDGIDVYFENVGGAVWDAVLPRLNDHARVPVCGLIATYNATEAATGRDRMPALMVASLKKRLRIQGFIQSDFASHTKDFHTTVAPLVADGTIKYLEDVVEGLEAAPEAFVGMLAGRNFGKVVVKL